jgi:DNA-binding LacI/PurR family transcriptional regulator
MLPELAGIYGPVLDPSQATVPHVTFAGHARDEYSDFVSFDDVDGGRQATQHLVGLGHTRIAFLALHAPDELTPIWQWAAQREEGWRQVLTAAGLATDGLVFHPMSLPADMNQGSRQSARLTSRMLVSRPDITAVVAANDYAALGLLDALQSAQIPLERWPAIVGFDNMPLAQGQLLTSLRLPPEGLGRVAADILWERRNGTLTGPPVHRHVPMSLLPRITSRSGWPLGIEPAAFLLPTT